MFPRRWIRLLITIAVSGASLSGFASEPAPESAPMPCATVQEFSGDVEIVDSTRSHLVALPDEKGVPCGGWITIKKGFVRISHRDGHRIHLGSESFVQIVQNDQPGVGGSDTLVLLKGELYAKVNPGSPELRVLSANGRARIRKGSGVVVYSGLDDTTQLIAVEGEASLENRFQGSRKTKLRGGESSRLDFRLARITPSMARAVALSSLRPKLISLRVPARETLIGLKLAKERGERVFAARSKALGPNPADPEPSKPEQTRKLASTGPDDAQVYAKMSQRLTGGKKLEEKVLFPERHVPPAKKASVEVRDLASAHGERTEAQEKERRRLMEELSKIRLE